MTPERLQELKKLCDEAKGPAWDYEFKSFVVQPTPYSLKAEERHFRIVTKDEMRFPIASLRTNNPASCDSANFAFIAASRTALPELIAELEKMTKMRDNIHRKLLNCDTARNGLSLMVSDLEDEVERFRDLAAGNICGYCWREMEERSEPGLKEENDRLRKQLEKCREQRNGYRENYWAVLNFAKRERPEIVNDDDAELDAIGKVGE